MSTFTLSHHEKERSCERKEDRGGRISRLLSYLISQSLHYQSGEEMRKKMSSLFFHNWAKEGRGRQGEECYSHHLFFTGQKKKEEYKRKNSLIGRLLLHRLEERGRTREEDNPARRPHTMDKARPLFSLSPLGTPIRIPLLFNSHLLFLLILFLLPLFLTPPLPNILPVFLNQFYHYFTLITVYFYLYFFRILPFSP